MRCRTRARRPTPHLKDWTAAPEGMVWLLLARAGVGDYSVRADPCDQLGPGCARVVSGALLDHVGWQGEVPTELAERLVGTMRPGS